MNPYEIAALAELQLELASQKNIDKATFFRQTPSKKAPSEFIRKVLFFSQGYKDSNLEMTESESVALPFGDSPVCF